MAPRTQHPAIRGRFRITSSELWDREALDLVEPAFIRFGDEQDGEFRMIAMQGDLDCRHGMRAGRPAVEFTWEGMDELDEAHGRGWVVLQEDGTLRGYLHFHMGDDSAFTAEPEQTHRPVQPSRGIGRTQARPRTRKSLMPKGRQKIRTTRPGTTRGGKE